MVIQRQISSLSGIEDQKAIVQKRITIGETALEHITIVLYNEFNRGQLLFGQFTPPVVLYQKVRRVPKFLTAFDTMLSGIFYPFVKNGMQSEQFSWNIQIAYQLFCFKMLDLQGFSWDTPKTLFVVQSVICAAFQLFDALAFIHSLIGKTD